MKGAATWSWDECTEPSGAVIMRGRRIGCWAFGVKVLPDNIKHWIGYCGRVGVRVIGLVGWVGRGAGNTEWE